MPSELMKQLVESEAVDPARLQQFHPRVRDRDDIKVLIDPQTEVIVLSSFDHINLEYYNKKAEAITLASYLSDVNIQNISPKNTDNTRRYEDFGRYIVGKDWLDFGCGLGGSLDEMKHLARQAIGLEPNMDRAEVCRRKGHRIISEIDAIPDHTLDCISLFHVFEHLTDPVGVVQSLKRKLRPSGVMICEVPHARDILIHTYGCEKFRDFTFWSEHLILHTHHSLSSLLKIGGFEHIEVNGRQRYALSNHLYWLSKGKPGGQVHWQHLSSDALNMEYSKLLLQLNRTDTLYAIARA